MNKPNNWPPAWLAECDDIALSGQKGKLAVDFIETFGVITKDSVAGKAGSPMVLRDWQKELVRYLYASDSRQGFKHKTALVGVSRKNGKSAIASSLAVFDLYFGPKGGEVYSIAAEKNQAAIVFKDAKKIIEANPELLEMAKLYRDTIEIPSTGSIYRVLSAEAYSKEGLNPTSVWADEIHAMPNRELWDVMSLAMGARGNLAHMVGITTAGVKSDSTGQDSIAYTLYNYGKRIATKEMSDPTFGFAWWEAPEDADHRDPNNWAIANPGIGDIADIDDFASAVRRTPEPEFRTKRMNQWVSSAISWLPTGAWDTCKGEVTVEGKDYIMGLDGSFSGDATVVTFTTIEEIPQVGIVGAWEKDTTIHDDTWRVDILEVEETIRQFVKANPRVKEIACDPYRWQRTMQILMEEGYPIVEYPSTNARRMIPACAKFYDAVVDGKMVHDGNPLLARHLSNAVVKVDNLGPRIVKETRSSNRRIDAAVAAVLSFDRATASRLEAEPLVPQFFM